MLMDRPGPAAELFDAGAPLPNVSGTGAKHGPKAFCTLKVNDARERTACATGKEKDKRNLEDTHCHERPGEVYPQLST